MRVFSTVGGRVLMSCKDGCTGEVSCVGGSLCAVFWIVSRSASSSVRHCRSDGNAMQDQRSTVERSTDTVICEMRGSSENNFGIVQLYFLHNYTSMVRSGVRASIQNTNTRGLYLMHGTAAFCSCSLLSRTLAISSADNVYSLLSPYST
jgi:hypothetical protein